MLEVEVDCDELPEISGDFDALGVALVLCEVDAVRVTETLTDAVDSGDALCAEMSRSGSRRRR